MYNQVTKNELISYCNDIVSAINDNYKELLENKLQRNNVIHKMTEIGMSQKEIARHVDLDVSRVRQIQRKQSDHTTRATPIPE